MHHIILQPSKLQLGHVLFELFVNLIKFLFSNTIVDLLLKGLDIKADLLDPLTPTLNCLQPLTRINLLKKLHLAL